MAIESFFIKEGMKESQIEEFLSKRFDKAEYSHIEIQRTPLGTRIIVYANKPGLVIGRSGRNIKEITEEIKEKFGLDNPMLDVKEVVNPFLNAQVVAARIAKSIERGTFYKKVVNFYINEIMKNGAIGVQIKVGGKMGGERGRTQKFKLGYIKHSGYYADNILDKGHAKAIVKLGVIGVEVRIMKDMPEDLSEKIADLDEKRREMIEKRGEEMEEGKPEPEEEVKKAEDKVKTPAKKEEKPVKKKVAKKKVEKKPKTKTKKEVKKSEPKKKTSKTKKKSIKTTKKSKK